jgi:predicted HAD superfamily phosphohydrolase YqeG
VPMLPLSALRLSPGLVGVLTDIDDTLTTEGAITPDALQALADLKAAGLRVIAITGRPVGWSEPFAQTWPLDAIVPRTGPWRWCQWLKKIQAQSARSACIQGAGRY